LSLPTKLADSLQSQTQRQLRALARLRLTQGIVFHVEPLTRLIAKLGLRSGIQPLANLRTNRGKLLVGGFEFGILQHLLIERL
jgi:hypothetical protein